MLIEHQEISRKLKSQLKKQVTANDPGYISASEGNDAFVSSLFRNIHDMYILPLIFDQNVLSIPCVACMLVSL